VSLRPRYGTGLHGAAKEKQERIKNKPLKARRTDTRSDNRNSTGSSAKPKTSGSPASRGTRNTRDRSDKR
ncbi:MAG TPA: 23S rRNA pseudouridylate synthase B, partial [Psychrobacter sp.]|nr:23S rRNA pseudouridylate synthase B [Psychrobacter sp.]